MKRLQSWWKNKNIIERRIFFIKLFLSLIALTLIGVDIYFAGPSSRYPTFSKLFYINKHKMIWFIFVFGCLVGKILYNRFTTKFTEERNGLIIILIIVALLYALGRTNWITKIPDIMSLSLFVLGLFCAYQFWPQYQTRGKTLVEKS
jgi:cell division protein FtsW (lipid II flippase)